MLKKVFVTLTVCLFVAGLTLQVGCGSKPGKPKEGTATSKSFGKGVGKTEDGEDVPDGMVTVD